MGQLITSALSTLQRYPTPYQLLTCFRMQSKKMNTNNPNVFNDQRHWRMIAPYLRDTGIITNSDECTEIFIGAVSKRTCQEFKSFLETDLGKECVEAFETAYALTSYSHPFVDALYNPFKEQLTVTFPVKGIVTVENFRPEPKD